MIESCSLKRMLLSLVILVGLSVLVLIIENYFTPESNIRRNSVAVKNINETGCWLKESFKITEECSPCSQFQIVSKHIAACVNTGFKESGYCSDTKTKFDRSCDMIPWIHKRNFWLFEGIISVIGIASSIVVKTRQKYLDKRFLEKIQKQVAAGV